MKGTKYIEGLKENIKKRQMRTDKNKTSGKILPESTAKNNMGWGIKAFMATCLEPFAKSPKNKP